MGAFGWNASRSFCDVVTRVPTRCRRGRWAAGRLCASASTAASGEGGFEPPHSEANTTSPNLGGGEEQSLDVEGMTSSPSLGCSDAAGAEAVASVQTRASRWSKDKEKAAPTK